MKKNLFPSTYSVEGKVVNLIGRAHTIIFENIYIFPLQILNKLSLRILMFESTAVRTESKDKGSWVSKRSVSDDSVDKVVACHSP